MKSFTCYTLSSAAVPNVILVYYLTPTQSLDDRYSSTCTFNTILSLSSVAGTAVAIATQHLEVSID